MVITKLAYNDLSGVCVILCYVTDPRYLIYMCGAVTEPHHIYHISGVAQQVRYLGDYIYIVRMSGSLYKESVSSRQQKTCD